MFKEIKPPSHHAVRIYCIITSQKTEKRNLTFPSCSLFIVHC
nr:MAG TPA: hypothetical protein [Caudoviricetes sp.]